MPDAITAVAPPRKKKAPVLERECIVQARAELVSLGGAVLLALCVLLTAVLVMAFVAPNVTGIQQFIALVLVVSAWGYFVNSVTERLSLFDHEIVVTSVLGRKHVVPLEELNAMLLIHEGLNLERGIETIEFRSDGNKIERVSLGPCWQRNKLESFLKSVEEVLRAPSSFEIVR